MTHTPTPWYIDGIHPRLIRGSPNHQAIATLEVAAYMGENAAFIVRACNVHDELVEALKECMKDSFTASDGMSELGRHSGNHKWAWQRYAKAVAALAKAKKGG